MRNDQIIGKEAHIYRDRGGSSDNYKADRLITLSVYLSVSIKCGHNEMDLYILHMHIYLVVISLSVITSSQGKYPGELLERRHMYTETGARGEGQVIITRRIA